MSKDVEGYMNQFNSFGDGDDEGTGEGFTIPEDEYVDFDVDDTLEDIEKAGYAAHIEKGLTGEKSAMRAFNPTAEKYVNVGRCRARVKYGPRTGEVCGHWAIRGSNICVEHGGRTPAVKKAARRRVEKAKETLMSNINIGVKRHIELIESNETPHSVQMQAVKLMYDVSGVTSREEEEVEEIKESPLAKLDGIMSEMRNRIVHEQAKELEILEEPELIDEGEIVEDGVIVEEDKHK